MSVNTTATIACFGGKLLKLAHNASTTGCEMKFNLFLPKQAESSKVPMLIWLSGLTCTGDKLCREGLLPAWRKQARHSSPVSRHEPT